MHQYKAPLRDVLFCFDELLDYRAHYAALGADLAGEDVHIILEGVARFAVETLAPLNASGDDAGARLEEGAVRSPAGFAEAYRRYVEAGWPRLANAERWGGQPAPYSLKLAGSEFMQAANHAWCMYALLNDGGVKTLSSFAQQAQVEAFVPKLVSGEWMSTMCLTEPQCGSDLNLVRCRAQPTGEGKHRIYGTKIFISSGEQDFSENIVHLVLARLPDAPAGTRGISLFVVPKRSLRADGSCGEPNALRCVSIERKMGLKASATCVMSFEGAEGWLVGEPNRGLAAMFVYINKSRLGSAQQAYAHIEAAHQASLAYARERLTGRAPDARADRIGADPLLAQPDVRRMLLTQKAFADGGRALVLYCAQWADLADSGGDAVRPHAERRLALLTPIVKGALSEWASEAVDLGVQILGGHGYMKESGLEQRVRDVRSTRIYEGATGVQAFDLLGRKILGSEAHALDEFIDEILHFCERSRGALLVELLSSAAIEWREVTARIASRRMTDASLIGAVAFDYLMLAGLVSLAYMWVRTSVAAYAALSRGCADTNFYRGKVQTAQFYFDRILVRKLTCVAAIDAHTASVAADSAFAQ